jgi:type I restriction enzyme R subunit
VGASLVELVKPMSDWTENTATQAEVKVFILDTLWQTLPRPPFNDEDTHAAADRVYDYVWQLGAAHEGARRVAAPTTDGGTATGPRESP